MGRAAARRLGVALGAGALVAVGLAATTVPATADTDTTIAYWQMNESGGDVMHDSSGNGIDGTIGDRVTVGQGYYSFAYVPPGAATAYAGQLVTVDDSRLNPGANDYAIEIRFRNSRSFGNLIQKGQNKTVGGYFKIELPAGKISCLYKDGTDDPSTEVLEGQSGVTSPGYMVGDVLHTYNDNQWYTIRCARTGSGVTMDVYAADGKTLLDHQHNAKTTGNISNSKMLSIGGKISCAQNNTTPGITCDYFPGQVDWVRLSTGAKSIPAPPRTGDTAPLQAVRDPGGKAIHVTSPDDDSVRSYTVTSRGSAKLVRTMSGSATGLTGPWGAAADGSGNIWVAAETGDRISRFSASSNGRPSATISGSTTKLSWPQGIALDGGARIYVANQVKDSVTVYAAGASGAASPTRTIKGGKTGLHSPVGVAVDASGRLYVSNWDTGTVTEYASSAKDNTAPIRTLTGLDHPYSLAVDATGALYVATDGTIRVFAAGASGKATPTRVVTVPDSSGVLVDPGRGLSVFTIAAGRLDFTDLRPVPPVTPTITHPSAVSKLRVTGTAKSKKRKVKWAPPTTTGGAAVTSYRIVVKHGRAKVVSRTLAASATKIKLRRAALPAGKAKAIVRAANSAGWGPKAVVTFKVRK